MIRSTYSHAAFAAKIVIAASLTLVIVFAAAALRPQMSALVPVTGPQAASAAAMRNLDLGAGYTLVTNANGTHIVAPEAPVKSAPVSQTLDLGAGYILRDGQIIAPARPDTSVRRTDLGAGYTLVTNAGNSQIVAPASSLKTAPVTSDVRLMRRCWVLRMLSLVQCRRLTEQAHRA